MKCSYDFCVLCRGVARVKIGDFLSSRGLMLSGSQSGAHAVCTYVPATTHAHANVIRMHVAVAWLPVNVMYTIVVDMTSTYPTYVDIDYSCVRVR